jgi:hypothetical protein
VRTVKASLEADVAGFLGPVLDAAEATEKLDDKVESLDKSLGKVLSESAKAAAGLKGVGEEADKAKRGVDDLDDKVEDLDRSLKDIPSDATKAAAAMALLKGSADEIEHSFEAVGEKSTAFTLLERRVAEARAEVRKLYAEFATTGNVDVFMKLGVAQGKLGDLEAFRKKMTEASKAVETLEGNLVKVPPAGSKASAALKVLNGDLGELRKNFESVGNSDVAFDVLERRITRVRGDVRKLGEEFLKTGDSRVFEQLGNAQGQLKWLEKFKTDAKKAIADGLKDGGADALGVLGSRVKEVFSGGIVKALSNPYVLGAASALAVALGSFVLSAVGGAIIAAGAVGVVGAGAAGAFMQSELVKKAWNGAIDDIQKKWMEGSKSFIGPMIDGANTVRKVFAGIDLQSMFSKASTFVKPLSEGAAWFARNVISGVDALVQKAGPVIDVLKQELPELGDAIASALEDIAGGNKGAADGLRDLFNLLEKGVRAFGVMVEAAEKMYHGFTTARDAVGDFFSYLDDHIPIIFKAADAISNWWPDADTEHMLAPLHATEDALGSVSKEAARTAEQVSQIDNAFSQLGKSVEGDFTNKIISQMFKMQDASLDFEESLQKLDKSVEKNGTSLDVHSEKGMANARALIAMAKANADLYASNVASGMSAGQAAQKYDEGTKRLEAEAKAAGFNAKQVEGLIGQYRNVPSKVQTLLATVGLTDAVNKLAQVLIDFRSLNGAEFKSKYTVTTTYRTVIEGGAVGGKGNTRAKDHLGGVHRRAAQGLVIPPSDPGTVLVAEPETGGEVNIPFRGISQMRALNLMQTVGDGYGLNVSPRGGGGAIAVQVEMRMGGTLRELGGLFMEMNRKGDLQFVVKT